MTGQSPVVEVHMPHEVPVRNKSLALAGLLAGLFLAATAIVLAQVNGQMILGQPGSVSGALTLMPPDGTGWYHIDNPGGQQIRISGGGKPGQYLYMTISHPGKVTIHGDLEVTGNLRARATQGRPSAPGSAESEGKADTASQSGLRDLQRQIDGLTRQVSELAQRVNR
ncbi:MAG: hypothetical protein M3167_04475 [Acidobacteriota bacterium]|nr:hypothetical protein [Acidobacteriota bacterium]